MRSNILYTLLSSSPVSVSYDEPAPAAPAGDAAPAAPAAPAADTSSVKTNQPPATPAAPSNEGMLTQEQFNKALAEDRRKHTAKLTEVEQQLSNVLETAQLTAAEKQELANSRDQLKKQLMTKEQLAAEEKRKLENDYQQQLDDANKARDEIQSKYEDSTIKRSLQDAAIGADAFNPAQIVDLLRGNTKLVDDKPMVTFNDTNAETGEPVELTLTPSDAVKRMSELKQTFGNLFKTNVIGGVGGGATVDGLPGSGEVDVKSMSPQQYAKLRETPEGRRKLGLN